MWICLHWRGASKARGWNELRGGACGSLVGQGGGGTKQPSEVKGVIFAATQGDRGAGWNPGC